MKNLILSFVALIFVSSASAEAQSTRFAVRGGPAIIVEDTHIGLAAAFDFMPGNAPIAFSPSVEIVSSEGLRRIYFGLNVVLTKPLDRSGVFGGVGVGSTRWSFAGSSRSALVYDALVGYRVMTSEKIGFFGQGKFFVNSKTDQDTDAFNSGESRAAFLFDNDLVASVGIVVILQ